MGALASKMFEDMPEDKPNPETPPSGSRYRPLAKFKDPRSPTSEVTRTPILVEKPTDTPTSMVAKTTPVLSGSTEGIFQDPRSPTTEFSRTPIVVKDLPQQSFDPRSPTEEITRTPIYIAKEGSNDGTPLTSGPISRISRLVLDDTGTSATEDSLKESPSIPADQKVLTDDSHPTMACTGTPVESEDNIPEIPKSSFEPALVDTSDTACLVGSKYIASESSMNDNSQLTNNMRKRLSKTLFKDIKPSQGQRSPLTTRNIDVNSPRAIVQRKQTTKLVMTKGQRLDLKSEKSSNSPRKNRMIYVDKENIAHVEH